MRNLRQANTYLKIYTQKNLLLSILEYLLLKQDFLTIYLQFLNILALLIKIQLLLLLDFSVII